MSTDDEDGTGSGTCAHGLPLLPRHGGRLERRKRPDTPTAAMVAAAVVARFLRQRAADAAAGILLRCVLDAYGPVRDGVCGAAAGLDAALSAALSGWREPTAIHDPGEVVVDWR